MPNILVYADVRAGVPTAPTLFALSEARRIARGAGASVFVLVASLPLSNKSLASLSIPLAGAGADKLLLCESDEFTDIPDDATHGRALDAAIARIPPLLVLFPAGGAGAILGPPLAARIGAPYAPWSDFGVSDADGRSLAGRGRVQVSRLRADGRTRRRLDPVQIERPIVATVGAGRCPAPTGNELNLEIDVLPLPAPRVTRPLPRIISRAPSPHAALARAAILVLVGDDHDSDASGIVAALSARFGGGEAASSTVAVAIAAETPRSVLTACCPEIVVRVGSCAATTARSPRTQVIRASSGHASLSDRPEADGDVDVVWTFTSPADLVDLVAQLGERP